MEDNALLTDLNAALGAATDALGINYERVQFAGFVRAVFDPGSTTKGALTYCSDDPTLKEKRFTIDTKNYDVQFAFRLSGAQRQPQKTSWGSGSPTDYDLNIMLLIASQHHRLLKEVLNQWQYLSNVEVKSWSVDDMRVMAEGFLFKAAANTPYDPDLRASSLTFNLLHAWELTK